MNNVLLYYNSEDSNVIILRIEYGELLQVLLGVVDVFIPNRR